MAELDVITESLRRQRKDLEESCDETLSRRSETAALLERIEDLRARCERTRHGLPPQGDQSPSGTPKT